MFSNVLSFPFLDSKLTTALNQRSTKSHEVNAIKNFYTAVSNPAYRNGIAF